MSRALRPFAVHALTDSYESNSHFEEAIASGILVFISMIISFTLSFHPRATQVRSLTSMLKFEIKLFFFLKYILVFSSCSAFSQTAIGFQSRRVQLNTQMERAPVTSTTLVGLYGIHWKDWP